MKALGRPDRWFLLALLAACGGGGVLLAQPFASLLSARDVEYYWGYHLCRSVFNAISAVCGSGLLLGDLARDYSPAGRWTLIALGELGALLFVAAVWQALARAGASMTVWRVPPLSSVLGLLLALQCLGAAICAAHWALSSALPEAPNVSAAPANQAALAAPDPHAGHSPDSARLAALEDAGPTVQAALCATASLGLVPGERLAQQAGLLVALGWFAALGWPIWLVVLPGQFKRCVRARAAAASGVVFSLILLLAAGLLTYFDSPRGGREAAVRDEARQAGAGPPASQGLGARLAQAGAAATFGMAVPPLDPGRASEGSKLVLSALLLLGGLGVGPGGGIGVVMLLWALREWGAGQTARKDADTGRWLQAGLATCAAMLILAIVGAAGLLAIEHLAADAYRHAPTLGDALVDASSAVGGGALTTGLLDTVTSQSLTGGIGQRVNLFPIGMGWGALLLILGRWTPLLILARLGAGRPPAPMS